jgi:hypothetical protein
VARVVSSLGPILRAEYRMAVRGILGTIHVHILSEADGGGNSGEVFRKLTARRVRMGLGIWLWGMRLDRCLI